MKEDYAERRRRLYDPLRAEGVFTWDEMYGAEYALATIHPITRDFRREIAEATEALGRIFAKTVAVVRRGPEALLEELGIPAAARRAVRLFLPESDPTLIGRFDFAPTPEGLKMLEFNSDTPTGIVEAFYVNGRVCEYFGAEDPNEGCEEHLRLAFRHALDTYRTEGYATDHVVFSALDWHEEDAGTTRYLLDRSGLDGRFVPLSDLRVEGERMTALVGGASLPVDVLYRLHALEILAEDRDDDGYPTGAHALELIARRRVAVINPPGALLSQTKAMQALIWALHEAGEFFDPEEHRIIETYMLPTYLENRFRGIPHVTKPIFGREGAGVTLYDASGVAVFRGDDRYGDQPMVFQRRVEMEPVQVETLKGPFRGRLLWGSFLIGGRASAILARVDGPVTGDMSFFLPVCYADARRECAFGRFP
jgi:glutathionylspermidine synthase